MMFHAEAFGKTAELNAERAAEKFVKRMKRSGIDETVLDRAARYRQAYTQMWLRRCPEETVEVYRGVTKSYVAGQTPKMAEKFLKAAKAVGGETTVMENPLSSWTVDPFWAYDFARVQGHVLTMKLPKSEFFDFWFDQHEVLVNMGNKVVNVWERETWKTLMKEAGKWEL